MAKLDPITYVEPDGLVIPEIGIWGLRKYNLVGHYCNIFTSGMKNKWERLVYLDLFAGAGYAHVREANRYLQTSALIAMSMPNPFHHHILSEYESEKCEALQTRIDRHFPGISYSLYQGDSNQNVDLICHELADINNRYSTLCFCFVDPYSLNLHFRTIQKLTQFRVDFLILLAVQMDFRRNLRLYFDPNSTKVEQFLGNPDWRADLEKSPDKQEIVRFLAGQYDKNMLNLGYKLTSEKKRIESGIKNLPLYYLAFYSRHPLGGTFYDKIASKGDSMQLKLF